jgi:hypothetical protein
MEGWLTVLSVPTCSARYVWREKEEHQEMARRPKGGDKVRAPTTQPSGASHITELAAAEEIDRILARLDIEIPKAQQSMDELLGRLRTTA